MTGLASRTLGRVIQGLALGALLFLALLEMLISAGGLSVFKYQGF